MKIGVVYPQTEASHDPAVIRDYAQTVEELGYSHILAYDHVVGANPDRPGGWRGPYTYRSSFHEPFTLFSYMAGLTQKVEFVTGIVILPQRETALVAKQTSMLDVLSNGRFRFGVGIGWNEVEYIALNQDFHTRGKRIEEQIALLRELWTQSLVTFNGRWHTMPDAGLNPLPVQRPIPIWIGGYVDTVLERVARLADGWFPGYREAAQAQETLDKLDSYLVVKSERWPNGRSRADLGIEPRLHYGDGDLERMGRSLEGWRAAGASHISLNTMDAGLTTAADHLAALRRAAEALL